MMSSSVVVDMDTSLMSFELDDDNWDICMSALLDEHEVIPIPVVEQYTATYASEKKPSVGTFKFSDLNNVTNKTKNSKSKSKNIKQQQQECDESSKDSDCGDDNTERGKKRKRVGSEEDALKISQATEAMLIRLNLDPDSAEGKKQRRRLRNRMSAAMHRERKKELIDTLEDQLKDKEEEMQALRNQIKRLSEENASLRQQLGLNAPENPAMLPSPAHSGYDDITSSDSDSEASSTASPAPKKKTFGSPISTGVSLLSVVCLLHLSFKGMPSLNVQFDEFPSTESSLSSVDSPVGRFLLSSDSINTPIDYEMPPITFNDPPENLVRPTMSSLYSYQDRLLQLYPKEITEPPKIKLTSRRSNLRSRQSFSTSLVPVTPLDRLEPTDHYSQVVMSRGRALLDPLLLSAHFFPAVSTSVGVNDKAVSTYRRPDHMSFSSTVNIIPSSIGKENLLMMVLPMSSVRWGSSWDDGSNSLLETIMRQANLAQEDSDISSDSLWVEIGCSVFQARLVRNVTAVI